jgi:6-phospho-3-hexuloisomerase
MADTNEIVQNIINELGSTLKGVDPEETARLEDAILAAKKVYFAGAGRSLLMIRGFAMRHLGLRSYVVGETVTPAIEAGDLLVIGSGSGETGALTIVANKAKKLGAKVALITHSPDSTIGRQADLVVRITLASGRKKLQPSGSTFEQSMLILCDAMVLEMLERGHLLAEHEDIDTYIMKRHANLE